MTKKLDVSGMVNELESSAFFQRPTPPPSAQASSTLAPAPVVPAQKQSTAVRVQPERTVTPNERTERTTERSNRSLLSELKSGVVEETRPTERYSFEIYTDMIPRIEEMQYRYKKRTGKKLSVSRIIREALEEYLVKAEKML